jgi:hypothetical protein
MLTVQAMSLLALSDHLMARNTPICLPPMLLYTILLKFVPAATTPKLLMMRYDLSPIVFSVCHPVINPDSAN